MDATNQSVSLPSSALHARLLTARYGELTGATALYRALGGGA